MFTGNIVSSPQGGNEVLNFAAAGRRRKKWSW